MESAKRVRAYFDREADRFDAIYRPDKPALQRLRDSLFRGVIQARFLFALQELAEPGVTLLDVGCGSGRYGLEFARRGAAQCVGIDFSPRMIDLARRESDLNGAGKHCEWVLDEWLRWQPSRTFQVVLAMGYFDYVALPIPHLEKMLSLCDEHLMCSFPKRWDPLALPRKIRFGLSGGFVRFYTRAEVLESFERAGAPGPPRIVDLGRDYLAHSTRSGKLG